MIVKQTMLKAFIVSAGLLATTGCTKCGKDGENAVPTEETAPPADSMGGAPTDAVPPPADAPAETPATPAP